MIANTKDMMDMVCDTTALEDERKSYLAELNILAEKYESTKEKYDEVLAAIEKRMHRQNSSKGSLPPWRTPGM